MRSRRRRAALVIVVAVAAVLVPPAAPASAHAVCDESNPADKSTVSSPPNEVYVDCTEPPAKGSSLQVYDACGERVDAGDYRYLGYRMTVTVNASTAGTYRGEWSAVSDLDAHRTTGSFTFSVANGEPCPGDDPAERPSGGGGNGSQEPAEDGGSSGSSDSSGSAEGSVVAAAGPEETSAGDGRQARAGASRSQDSKSKNVQKRKRRSQDGNRERDISGDAIASSAQERERTPPPREMPVDWLLISLGIAALIGVAGGFVYVGIVGDD